MLPLTKRQREILDYLQDFIQQHGYAPSLEEIGRRFGLSSLATVHKHLTNLQEKGFIKRAWNRSRSVEMIPTSSGGRSVDLPLLGYVAAGAPIEAVAYDGDDRGARGNGGPARHVRAARPRQLDDRRANLRRRLRHHRRSEDRAERRDGRGAAERLGRHAEEALSRERPRPAAAGESRHAAASSSTPTSCRCRASLSASCENIEMSESKQINFTIVPDEGSDATRTYANFCAVNHTPFDFTLTFCEMAPLSEKDIRAAESEHVVRAPVKVARGAAGAGGADADRGAAGTDAHLHGVGRKRWSWSGPLKETCAARLESRLAGTRKLYSASIPTPTPSSTTRIRISCSSPRFSRRSRPTRA